MEQFNSQIHKSSSCIKALRLRMGWSQSDLARRTDFSVDQIQNVEAGRREIPHEFWNRLEILFHQADLCSEEVYSTPILENLMDESAVDQVDFSRVQGHFES